MLKFKGLSCSIMGEREMKPSAPPTWPYLQRSAPKEGYMIIKADSKVGRIRIHPEHQQKEMDTVCKQEEEKGRRRQ